MAYETKPTVFKWASSGAVIAMNGTKQALGWIKEMVPFQQLNWLFNQITKHLKHLNERGIGDWDSATVYEVGALVMHTDNEAYRCIVNPPAFQAPSNATYWKKFTTHTTDSIPAASESVAGKSEIATVAEAQTHTNDLAFLTSLKLENAYKAGADQNLGVSGYQKLPGGIIIQWFTATESNVAQNFFLAFPTAALAVFATHNVGGTTTAISCNVGIVSASQFTLTMGATGGSETAKIFAIGY